VKKKGGVNPRKKMVKKKVGEKGYGAARNGVKGEKKDKTKKDGGKVLMGGDSTVVEPGSLDEGGGKWFTTKNTRHEKKRASGKIKGNARATGRARGGDAF